MELALLQPLVPFELELHEGNAIVSLVFFEMRRFRPARGGRLAELLFLPAATNRFLNVRTYVRHHGESGVYFMTQWLSHPFCLAGRLPGLRLPWRLGRMSYQHAHEEGSLNGVVSDFINGQLTYSGSIDSSAEFSPCETGSLGEFTMERYTAFALRGRQEVVFRVWHNAWPQCPAKVTIRDEGLLQLSGDWFRHARLAGANYTTGCEEVWMGHVRALKHR